MKQETLELMLDIERYGTISEAAKHIYLSQPAISQQIRQLEKELGVMLYNRKCAKNQISLTQTGRVVLEYAKQFAALRQKMTRDIEKLSNNSISMTIGTGLNVGTYIVPYLIESFKKSHSECECHIKMLPGKDLFDSLQQKQYHMIISSLNPKLRQYSAVHFFDDELCLVAPSFFNLPDEIEASDLKDYPLILREENSLSRNIIEQQLKKSGVTLNSLQIVMELFSPEAIKRAVETGGGIGFLPTSSIIDLSHNSNYKIVSIKNLKFCRPLFIVTHHKEAKEAYIGKFIDFALFGEWKNSLPTRDIHT